MVVDEVDRDLDPLSLSRWDSSRIPTIVQPPQAPVPERADQAVYRVQVHISIFLADRLPFNGVESKMVNRRRHLPWQNGPET